MCIHSIMDFAVKVAQSQKPMPARKILGMLDEWQPPQHGARQGASAAAAAAAEDLTIAAAAAAEDVGAARDLTMWPEPTVT